MNGSELETGILSGKRQTLVSVSSWISRELELARKNTETSDKDTVLCLTLSAMEALKEKIDSQLRKGVNTLDCADFIPD